MLNCPYQDHNLLLVLPVVVDWWLNYMLNCPYQDHILLLVLPVVVD
jgi:hypothetical protein